ncbi:hypothetical protein HPB52_015009 [Rhipicephalus sanguineus]|uniref:ABC transporter domain-containing protein n=1 Tax=Rhipicephalus sanguineus TaxID=34632 RepID=A0A9D4Q710_RHISA|nr:hypothetical protein HPB52_015009 [Rhipicephalus sanguineus]
MCARSTRWRQLRLLLWKSVYLYKLRRNWTITALEVLTPLLLTLVQTYLHCSREESSPTGTSTPAILASLTAGDMEAEEVVKPSFYFPSIIAFELLRIAGISDAVYWLSAFLSSLMVMSLETVLITSFLTFPIFCEPAILPQSDISLVLFMLMLYAVYCDLFCLLISCVVKTPVYAVFATVCLWMLTYEVPIFFMDLPGSVEYADLSLGQKVSTSIFPNMALHWIVRIISAHEENNQGARWSNIQMAGSPYDNVTLTVMLCVVLGYCVLYAVLVWYLDNVWPWQYGIPKEPLFFAKVSYWYPKAPSNLQYQRKDATEASIPRESIGDRNNPGIVLDNVTKVYSKNTVALYRVSLKAYPGDVTVLLGRNGAGKTTLLRLITGLEQASAGSVYVAGHDAALDTDAARRSMGFCPQENVLFLGLTVLEHLQFFARLLKELEGVHGRALQSLSVYVAALEDVLRQVERDLDRRKTSSQPQAPQQLPDVHVMGQESEVGYPAVAAIEANFSSSGDLRPHLSQQLGALVAKKLRYGSRDFRLPVLMLLLPLSRIRRKVAYNHERDVAVFGGGVACLPLAGGCAVVNHPLPKENPRPEPDPP